MSEHHHHHHQNNYYQEQYDYQYGNPAYQQGYRQEGFKQALEEGLKDAAIGGVAGAALGGIGGFGYKEFQEYEERKRQGY